jgi:hypothetical protein
MERGEVEGNAKSMAIVLCRTTANRVPKRINPDIPVDQISFEACRDW